ncbi:fimbrial protein [Shigella dysenteriae]|nr:fimbrial protein [Shigella dysenteriae]HBP9464866.1 fimbrial protein [Shigella dysenteriae]
MKRVITLFAVLLMGWSVNAWSFACKTANGTAIPIGGGSANVYVNLAPVVNVGQNLVVDLSTQIFCHNDYPETITDYVTLQRGSAYGGVLSNFSGTVKYSGSSYPFPTTSETPRVVYNSRTDKPWPVALYLTPVSSAGNSIFTNIASFSPAQGVGVQLTRNGTIIPANNTVSLGAVGTSAVSLGLTANYARTGGQVTAGNVQSIIGVTFVYQ